MLCLSSTSEDTGAVATSAPDLYAEQKLALLDGKRIGATSALLTSTVSLSLNLREDFAQPIGQTVLLSVHRRVLQHRGEIAEWERVVEEE